MQVTSTTATEQSRQSLQLQKLVFNGGTHTLAGLDKVLHIFHAIFL